MTHYISTRGQTSSRSFSDSILEGLAPDGGLYVPEAWPTITRQELEAWRALPYADMAAHLFVKFAPELGLETLIDLCRKTYTSTVFAQARDASDVARIFPVHKLRAEGLFLQELSNGPTLAFKDAAMQFIGHLMDYLLEQQDRTLTILGATSGDTGSAAIHALRGKKRIKVVMLSPQGRMSDFQRAQMYSVLDDNILNIAVDGTFDDCQDLVKTVNADAAFKSDYCLGAVNSINWARVMAQTAYYISAALQTDSYKDDPVSFSVPSGNFGNAFAGIVAKLMGAPINRIIVATNENDVLHRLFTTGRYEPAQTAFATSSPSMDITKASNFERLAFEASGHDGAKIGALWKALGQEGKIDFAKSEPNIWRNIQSLGLASSRSTHADRLAHIRTVYETEGLLIDPHTADGIHGALSCQKDGEKIVVLETAQPAKFAATVQQATGQTPPVPKGFEELLGSPQRVTPIANDPDELKAQIQKFV
jgi:threonine synthase